MDAMEFCANCSSEIPISGVNCNVCQEHIGFPNVRLAIKEKSFLEKRHQKEMASVSARGIEKVANEFELAVDKANVVMARSVTQLLGLVENDNQLLTTFHHQVGSGSRIAENNEFDPNRAAVESTVHPLYYENIHYAVLSLNDIGSSYYGGAHIKLRSSYIKNRTTFFQENPFDLLKKLKMNHTEPMPCGYRSTWEDKGKLALCKHHANLELSSASYDDFQSILLSESESQDFIEANIYGNIHHKCFELVTLVSGDKVEKLLMQAHENKFDKLDIKVEFRER